MKRVSLFVLLLVVAASLSFAQEAGLPEPGPENSGLRLRLVLDNYFGRHMMRMEILNATDESVKIVAKAKVRADIKQILKDQVDFIVTPELQCPPYQISVGPDVKVPNVYGTIKPQEPFVVYFDDFGWFDFPNPADYCFPSDGLYHIRAKVVLNLEDGGSVTLESNEQELAMGGSRLAPKPGVVGVEYDHPRDLFILRAGRAQRIQVGDKFYTFEMGRGRVIFEVKNVLEDTSEMFIAYNGQLKEGFPQPDYKGERVYLCRKDGCQERN